MSNKVYLITGAAGFIGGAVLQRLLDENRFVRALVRTDEQQQALLQKFPQAKHLEIVRGDLRDLASLQKAAQGVYGVFHIAAVYRQAGLPEETFFEVNAEGTRHVFEAAIQAGVKRVVYCSTGGVLGHIANPPGKDTTPYAPGDMYQRSKVEAEKIALSYFKERKISGGIIRPAMVYGPADTRHLKMFKMISRERFFYVGKGRADTHFIDVRDLARSFIMLMDREDIQGEIFHIAGRSVMPLQEAVNFIADCMGVKRPWLHLPVVPVQTLGTLCELICTPFGINPPIFRRRVDFFTKSRNFDTEKALHMLGFQSEKSFQQEVPEIIAWYRKQGWI